MLLGVLGELGLEILEEAHELGVGDQLLGYWCCGAINATALGCITHDEDDRNEGNFLFGKDGKGLGVQEDSTT